MQTGCCHLMSLSSSRNVACWQERIRYTWLCDWSMHAWLSAGSVFIVGPCIIISNRVVSEAGTDSFWLSGANVPSKELFTCKSSFLAIIAAFAKQTASQSVFLASRRTLLISWLRMKKTSPSLCAVRSGKLASIWDFSLVEFTLACSPSSSLSFRV